MVEERKWKRPQCWLDWRTAAQNHSTGMSLEELVVYIRSKQGIILKPVERKQVHQLEQVLYSEKRVQTVPKLIFDVGHCVIEALKDRTHPLFERAAMYAGLLATVLDDVHIELLKKSSTAIDIEDQAWIENSRRHIWGLEQDLIVLGNKNYRGHYHDEVRKKLRQLTPDTFGERNIRFLEAVIQDCNTKGGLAEEFRDAFTIVQADAYIRLGMLKNQPEYYRQAITLLTNIKSTTDAEKRLSRVGECYFELAKLEDARDERIRLGLQGVEAYGESAVVELSILRSLSEIARMKKIPYFSRSLQRMAAGFLTVGNYLAEERRPHHDILENASRLSVGLDPPHGKYYEIRWEVVSRLLETARKRIMLSHRLIHEYPLAYGMNVGEAKIDAQVLWAEILVAQGSIPGLSKKWRRDRLHKAQTVLCRAHEHTSFADYTQTSKYFQTVGNMHLAMAEVVSNKKQCIVAAVQAYKRAVNNGGLIFARLGEAYFRLAQIVEVDDE